jgi:hypothetical protein
MFCHFCGIYLGLLHLGYFCPDCAYLRRLYLIHDRKSFLDRVSKIFLSAVPEASEPGPNVAVVSTEEPQVDANVRRKKG